MPAPASQAERSCPQLAAYPSRAVGASGLCGASGPEVTRRQHEAACVFHPTTLWQPEGGGYAASLAGNPGAIRGSTPQEPPAQKRRNLRPPDSGLPSPWGVGPTGILPPAVSPGSAPPDTVRDARFGKGANYAKVVVMQRCHAVGTNLHPTPTGICGASESTNALRLRPDLGLAMPE